MNSRAILHCDLNNFYASVECVLNPSLIGVPIAVCGNPEARHGIVLAKNQLAKKAGVKTAEAIWEAKLKCPDLVCVPPHHDIYLKYSRRVQEIYKRYTDLVEPFGLDECWLDVTASKIFGSPLEIANLIRESVKAETGLTISVGVSFTKVFAKLGSDMKKPDAVTVISIENYKSVAWPVPVQEMFMVGRKTAERLKKLNIFTIGDLANSDAKLLNKIFGINALKIIDSANGIEIEAVSKFTNIRDMKSVGHGTTTSEDMTNYIQAEKVIYMLSEMVATRMRRYGVIGLTVCLDLRASDLSHTSRQLTLPSPTSNSSEIANSAIILLKKHWNPNMDLPLRTLTVSTTNLLHSSDNIQSSFFDSEVEKDESLDKAMDKIRAKHGFNSILRANTTEISFAEEKKCEEDDLLPFIRKR